MNVAARGAATFMLRFYFSNTLSNQRAQPWTDRVSFMTGIFIKEVEQVR